MSKKTGQNGDSETALIRVRKSTKEKLVREADKNRRSIVEEASLRLDESFKATVNAAA